MDWLNNLMEVRSNGFTRTGIFELVTIFLNTATVAMLLFRLFGPEHKLVSNSAVYRAALGIITFGLAAQIPISFYRLLEWKLPSALVGMWSMKDVGLFLLIFAVTFLGARRKP